MTRVCNAYPLFGGLSNITFRLKMIGCLHPFCWCLTRTYSKPWWLASTIDDSWPFRACFQGICATRPNWGPFKTLKSISLTEMLHSSGRKNCWTFRSSKYIGSTILGAQTQGKLFVKMTFLLVLAWNIPILTKDSVGIACLKVPGMYTVHIYIHITWIYIYMSIWMYISIFIYLYVCSRYNPLLTQHWSGSYRLVSVLMNSWLSRNRGSDYPSLLLEALAGVKSLLVPGSFPWSIPESNIKPHIYIHDIYIVCKYIYIYIYI